MENTKLYNNITLIASQVDFLEEIEKKIGENIPCREDREAVKKQIAQAQAQAQAYQPPQNSAQTILQTQYQAITAQATQMEQMSKLPIEALEMQYKNQFLAQTSPQMKANLEMQLKTLVPMYGEDHPSVKQIKDMLEMDEGKADLKAKSLARFMVENFKLQSMIKERTQALNKIIYSQQPYEELESEYLEYFKVAATPEYQSQLKITLDIGIQELGEMDPNLASLKPFLGLTEEKLEPMAKQSAQNSYNGIQSMLKQYGVQLNAQTQTQTQTQAPPAVVQSVSKRSANVGQFGFICEDQYIIGLNLGWKNLELLPDSVGELIRLRFLDLTNSKLEQLPENIGNLVDLEELNLKGTLSNEGKPIYNEIDKLPESFCKLINLKKLEISGNGLLELPEHFGQLSSLEEVIMDFNKISSIPNSVGDLLKLKHLNLNSNKISSIPESIGQLKELNDFFISFNSISQIPECIGNLENLQRFMISNNSLSEIPLSLSNLSNLQSMYIDNNQLTTIPEEITKLNLTLLSAKGNQLPNLPYFLWTMTSLVKLYLEGNPLSEEEAEIAQRDSQAILDYCRQRASIAVMIINTEVDAEAHRINDLKNYLEGQSEIFTVLSADESLMSATDLILFMATAGSIKLPQYVNLLKTAREQKIEIIPLKGLNIDWPDLSIVDLSRELGHEFTPNDFDGFCERIYSYIQQIKRTHNIFKDKSAILLKKAEEEGGEGDPQNFAGFKEEFNRIIKSEDMKQFFEQFKGPIASYYNNSLSAKIAKEPFFLSQVFSLFPSYFQQKNLLKQYTGGN
ncbi:MAG: leucine-rich repeat domain-containing protein [Promethearchaeota archaeon]